MRAPEADWADHFANALLDPQQAAPAALKSWNGSDPAARLGIHRNNVLVSLVDCLADTFPVVQSLVGVDFFRAMASIHVRASPPASPILSEYGSGLAAFIDTFEPAGSVPYLSDVARLEFARLQACHAADQQSLDAHAIQALVAQGASLDHALVGLHPSLRLLSCNWAAASIWAAHQGEAAETVDAIAQIAVDQAEDILILRPALDVLVLRLAPGGACFVDALAQDASLSAAAATGVQAAPEFDLNAMLALLIGHGAMTSITTPGRADS